MQALVPLTGAVPQAAPPGAPPIVGGALAVSMQVVAAAAVVALAVALASLEESGARLRELLAATLALDEPPPARLVLKELSPANRIDALVLQPDGRPLAEAEVEIAEQGHEGVFMPMAETGVDGRIVLPVRRGASYAVRALDPEHRWGAVTEPGVAAGTRELVLRFVAGRVIELTALSEGPASIDVLSIASG